MVSGPPDDGIVPYGLETTLPNEIRLRLAASAASKERRLAALLEGRAPDPALLAAAREAQVLGSLALSGVEGAEDARAGLLRAMTLVDRSAPLTTEAIVAWHRAAGGSGRFRATEAARPGTMPPAPPEFIASRLSIFEQWMNAPSASELTASQQGALALARIVEVKPFDDANGRVSRLAASHLMVRAGARPPILVAADAPRLQGALEAAFQLHTEPLAALLEEAAERALDVMIRAAEANR